MHKRVELRAHSENRNWTSECLASQPAPVAVAAHVQLEAPVATSRFKRAFDAIMSFGALLFFLPLLLTIAMLVKLESRGPALFRQRRTGLNGAIFTVFKFRTMTVAEDGDVVRQATRDDTRITALAGC